jgi:hypothetical protein
LPFTTVTCDIYSTQLEDYREELEEMKNMTRQEYVAHLRRYDVVVVVIWSFEL